MPDGGDLRCSIGLHRWTKGDRTVFTCFRCSKQRAAGKAIRCRVGLHRWSIARKQGGEPYRECLFCRKYGGSPTATEDALTKIGGIGS